MNVPCKLAHNLESVCDIVDDRTRRFTGRLRNVLGELDQRTTMSYDDGEILRVATDCCVNIANCIKENLEQLNETCKLLLSSSSSSKRPHELIRAQTDNNDNPTSKKQKSEEDSVVIIDIEDDDEDENDKAISKTSRTKGKEEEQEETTTTTLRIWTDGACKNNGKKGAVAGIGVYFGHQDARNVSEPYHPQPGLPATNQTAELSAAIRALEIGLKQSGVQNIEIHTDSKYTIDCVTNWIYNWKCNKWLNAKGKPVKNQPLIQRLYELAFEQCKVKVKFVYVPAHSGIHNNECADKLASEGCKSAHP